MVYNSNAFWRVLQANNVWKARLIKTHCLQGHLLQSHHKIGNTNSHFKKVIWLVQCNYANSDCFCCDKKKLLLFQTINQHLFSLMQHGWCDVQTNNKKKNTLCASITFWTYKLSSQIALEPPICKCHVQPFGNGSALSERPWKHQPKSKSAGHDIEVVMSGIHSHTVNPR